MPRKTKISKPQFGAVLAELRALRAVFVKSASWSAEGDLVQVEFFAPEAVLHAQSRAAETAVTSGALGDPGDTDTPEIEALRQRIENAKTADEAASYQQMLDRALMAHMAYYSS